MRDRSEGRFSCISIHSLRMEGDFVHCPMQSDLLPFQSTPSAWRETPTRSDVDEAFTISIHSLRMEGDRIEQVLNTAKFISIHSLRMEGDFYAPVIK